MREHWNATAAAGVSQTVYVIFRVFNLGKPDIGVRVYLDPDSLRQEDS